MKSPVDHISFRVFSISELRSFFHSLISVLDKQVQTVSHGSTWSIYFRDPEQNRFEIFTDTPWHVDQPCKFDVDLDLPDEKLMAFTHQKIQQMSGFTHATQWQASHKAEFINSHH
ncbi:hypothetical protein [uncultured Shewanella sp.]|uniref:VOC family protein n=1 Tax=uncultured Shewanella sp. TaxID=173975 RepID=UPI0026059E2F|nr:hypothetical protein [uncultured Shewanella sp.]